MKRLSVLRKYSGTTFAFVALIVAQMASSQFSFIYYQDEIPEKVKALNNK